MWARRGVLVFGSESHRMVTDGSSAGFTGSRPASTGIVATWGLHPLWTIPSSFLFGGLLTGATNLQRALQVPAAMAVALDGIVVIFVVSSGRVRTRINAMPEDTATSTGEKLPNHAQRARGGVSEFFTVSVLVATLASGIRLATPYLFATPRRDDRPARRVLNLGVEHVMLLGAFFAHWTALETGNLWLAVLVGLAAAS